MDLGTQLLGRAQEGDAFLPAPPPEFANQQSHECFPGSGRQFYCKILGFQVLGMIGIEHLLLVPPQKLHFRVAFQVPEEENGAFCGSLRTGWYFEKSHGGN